MKILSPANIAAIAVVLAAYLLTGKTQLALVLGLVNIVALYGSAEVLRRRYKTQAATVAASGPAPAVPGSAAPAATPAAATSS